MRLYNTSNGVSGDAETYFCFTTEVSFNQQTGVAKVHGNTEQGGVPSPVLAPTFNKGSGKVSYL
jgi:hypothetical protein